MFKIGFTESRRVSLPTDNPTATEPGNATGQQLEEPSFRADLKTLIDEIEGAEAGSTTLDARIHFGYRVAAQSTPDLAALLIEDGISWPAVEAVIDEQIPPFTTSLDAALDSEDISFVMHSTKRGKWGAMQRARCGKEVIAWAATEPLARRLAALLARYVDIEIAAKPAAALPPRLGTEPRLETTAEEPPAEDENKEWEVSF